MICENCGKEHDGKYGSGRFCSEKCARSFSANSNKVEANQKRKITLTGHILSDETKQKISDNNGSHKKEIKEKISYSNKKYWENLSEDEKEELNKKRSHGRKIANFNKLNSICDLSIRTALKILDRMQVGCLICGWDKAHCDIHHIKGRKIEDANNMKNLTYVCPNCHRLIHSGIISESNIISLEDTIGESWKDFYFG